jgi:hypothetical protein
MFGFSNSVVEREMLQPVNRIMMNKALHRPELRDRLARLRDQMPQPLTFLKLLHGPFKQH